MYDGEYAHFKIAGLRCFESATVQAGAAAWALILGPPENAEVSIAHSPLPCEERHGDEHSLWNKVLAWLS